MKTKASSLHAYERSSCLAICITKALDSSTLFNEHQPAVQSMHTLKFSTKYTQARITTHKPLQLGRSQVLPLFIRKHIHTYIIMF